MYLQDIVLAVQNVIINSSQFIVIHPKSQVAVIEQT